MHFTIKLQFTCYIKIKITGMAKQKIIPFIFLHFSPTDPGVLSYLKTRGGAFFAPPEVSGFLGSLGVVSENFNNTHLNLRYFLVHSKTNFFDCMHAHFFTAP